MNKIKFSHCYKKLLDEHNDMVASALLLEVLTVRLEDLSESFLDYDTDDGLYELPKKGEYLMLIFEKPHETLVTAHDLFTTLRRSTPQKKEYYRSLIGQPFEIELTNAPEKTNG